jgi:hypothetical protein
MVDSHFDLVYSMTNNRQVFENENAFKAAPTLAVLLCRDDIFFDLWLQFERTGGGYSAFQACSVVRLPQLDQHIHRHASPVRENILCEILRLGITYSALKAANGMITTTLKSTGCLILTSSASSRR